MQLFKGIHIYSQLYLLHHFMGEDLTLKEALELAMGVDHTTTEQGAYMCKGLLDIRSHQDSWQNWVKNLSP